MDLEATQQLLAALGEAETSRARAVVLSGAGGSFCSGADLGELKKAGGSPEHDRQEALRRFGEAFEKVCSRVASLDLPVIAAMEGPALGGGATLALFCDFRISTPSLRFGIPASRLGITLSETLLVRIVAVAGPQGASDLLLRSREYSAEEALVRRIVDEVVESPQALWERAAALALDIAEGARHSVAAHKRAIGRILASRPERY